MKRNGSIARDVITVIVLAVVIAIIAWMVVYHPSDPKSLQYLLWKRNFGWMRPSDIYGAMIGDENRDNLVVGLSISEIESRFGRLQFPPDLNAYQKSFAERGPYKGEDIAFLQNSNWVIVLKDGRVTELVLVKGW